MLKRAKLSRSTTRGRRLNTAESVNAIVAMVTGKPKHKQVFTGRKGK